MTTGPGLAGALLVGFVAKALAWARRPLVPVDHLEGHVASYIAPDPLEPPFVCLLASGGTRCSSPCTSGAARTASGRRSTMQPGRRSTREPVCSGSGTRAVPRSTDSRARATPRRSRSRLPGARARLLVLRAQDCAPLHRPRPREGPRRGDRPIWPPRTSGRSCVRSPAEPTRRPSRPGSSASPSSAESRPTAACARLFEARFAPLALCTDNAAMIASAARFATRLYPAYLGLDAYASFS